MLETRKMFLHGLIYMATTENRQSESKTDCQNTGGWGGRGGTHMHFGHFNQSQIGYGFCTVVLDIIWVSSTIPLTKSSHSSLLSVTELLKVTS